MRTIQQREALAKLRDLQGVPLSVLVTLFILAKPVGKRDISRALRRDEKTISSAVDFLEQEGYVIRVNYRSWALAGGQMFLPGLELLPSGRAALPETVNSPVSERNRKNSRFETVNSPVSGHVLLTTTNNKEEGGNVPDDLTRVLGLIRIGGEGVSRRAWSSLAALEWVTPDYLLNMASWVATHDDPGKRNIGFLMHCVRSGDIVEHDRDRVSSWLISLVE